MHTNDLVKFLTSLRLALWAAYEKMLDHQGNRERAIARSTAAADLERANLDRRTVMSDDMLRLVSDRVRSFEWESCPQRELKRARERLDLSDRAKPGPEAAASGVTQACFAKARRRLRLLKLPPPILNRGNLSYSCT